MNNYKMKTRTTSLIIAMVFAVTCLLAVLPITSLAYASVQSVEGTLVEDTFVSTDSTGTVYGTQEVLRIYRADNGGTARHAYIKFDLSAVLAHADYASFKGTAKLTVTLNIVQGGSGFNETSTIGVRALPAATNIDYWTENDLTWTNSKTTGDFANIAYANGIVVENSFVFTPTSEGADTGVLKVSLDYADLESFVNTVEGSGYGYLTLIFISNISALRAAAKESTVAAAPSVAFTYEKSDSYAVSCEFDSTLGTVTADKNSVDAGGSVTWTVTPLAGNSIASVKLNDESVTLDSENKYTATNVLESVKLSVTFKVPVALDLHKITATEDSWIAAKSTGIYGFDYTLRACSSNNNRAYLKFDLSGVDLSKDINSLELVVYINSNYTEDTPKTFKVRYGTSNEWSEDTLVWANKASNTSEGQVTIEHDAKLGALRVDVTSIYNSFIKGGSNTELTLILWGSASTHRVEVVATNAFDVDGKLLDGAKSQGIPEDAFAPYLDFNHEFDVSATGDNDLLGTVSVDKQKAYLGEQVKLTVTVQEGKKIKSVKLNGTEITLAEDNTFTATVNQDMDFQVEFAERDPYIYTVTGASSANGRILPQTETVTEGETGSYTVTVIPNAGYAISAVYCNGTDVTSSLDGFVVTLDKTTVTQNVEISADFTAYDDGKIYPVFDTAVSDETALLSDSAMGAEGTIGFKTTDISLRAGLFVLPLSGFDFGSQVHFKLFSANELMPEGKLSVYALYDLAVDATATFNSLAFAKYCLQSQAAISADAYGIECVSGLFVGEYDFAAQIDCDLTQAVKLAKLLGKDQLVLVAVNSYNESLSTQAFSVYSLESTKIVDGAVIRPYAYVENTENETFSVSIADGTDVDKVTVGNGENTYDKYETVCITLAPAQGETVESVKANGVALNVIDNKCYLNGFDTDVQIEAVFAPVHSVAVMPDEGCTYTVTAQSVTDGDSVTVYLTMANGYKIASVKCNGVDVAFSGNKVICDNVTADIEIVVVTERI